MSVIDPDGLFNGQRLRRCSDMARLRWPYYYHASNGFGILAIDPDEIIATAFIDFKTPLTDQDFFSDIAEYREAGLLFVYEVDSEVWGKWDTPDKYLSRHKTIRDLECPQPDETDFKVWKSECKKQKAKRLEGSVLSVLESFRKVQKSSEDSGAVQKSSARFKNVHNISEDSQTFPLGRGGDARGGTDPTLKPQIAKAVAPSAPPTGGLPVAQKPKGPDFKRTPEEQAEFERSIAEGIRDWKAKGHKLHADDQAILDRHFPEQPKAKHKRTPEQEKELKDFVASLSPEHRALLEAKEAAGK